LRDRKNQSTLLKNTPPYPTLRLRFLRYARTNNHRKTHHIFFVGRNMNQLRKSTNIHLIVADSTSYVKENLLFAISLLTKKLYHIRSTNQKDIVSDLL